jgi:hypothetical protein
VNTSPNILVMTDEAHRSQYSMLGANLDRAISNAARIWLHGHADSVGLDSLNWLMPVMPAMRDRSGMALRVPNVRRRLECSSSPSASANATNILG